MIETEEAKPMIMRREEGAFSSITPGTGDAPPGDYEQPRMWGLTPVQMHDRFWAARGVQVIRQAQRGEISSHAELFLLIFPGSLVLFRIGRLVEMLTWVKLRALFIRLRDDRGYRERATFDNEHRFVRFERMYGKSGSEANRAALSPDPEVARWWQEPRSPLETWRQMGHRIPPALRTHVAVPGRLYEARRGSEVMQFVRDLVRSWRRPDATIAGLKRLRNNAWAGHDVTVKHGVRFLGPAWIGEGRQLDAGVTVVGPAVLWDDPAAPPGRMDIDWREIEPLASRDRIDFATAFPYRFRPGQRLFDILFSVFGIALTLPLYPCIVLAIVMEDGWPFFFAHRRETVGGQEFHCLKFRSMRNNAERIKAEFKSQNQVDGPQFFIENDPRLTRVGRFLRKYKLDELPQFLNVLAGHMSIVGPRPSPFHENQFCPAWRDARLSVRPGITGLWQVMRTRSRGLDFQEWIRYDIEYVEKAGFWLDLRILYKTVGRVLKGS